jgi:hypothetical protein
MQNKPPDRYSGARLRPRTTRKRRDGSKRRFIQLWTNVKRSQAYHGLSLPARGALTELLDRYKGTGTNNGMIGLGVRELAEELKCSQRTAGRALKELDDANLARPMVIGVWPGRKATEWRLTFYVCDKTGELPIKNWAARSECHQRSATGSPRKRKPPPRVITNAQTPKNPMNGKSLSVTRVAHIDIHQGHRDLGVCASETYATRAAPVDEYPDIPEFLRRKH